MFCYQCQEAAKNQGCTLKGVCGKTHQVANLQDLLIHLLQGISHLAVQLRNKGVQVPNDCDEMVVESLFMTITNANFDQQRFVDQIHKALRLRDILLNRLQELGETPDPQIANYDFLWMPRHAADLEDKALKVGVLATENEDIRSLRSLLTYGLKGMAAYAEHAANLNYKDPSIYAFIEEALEATLYDHDIHTLLSWVIRCGEYGVKTMALLDQANTETYGHPEITKVNMGVQQRPGILISGHDLRDMHDLLEQSKDAGVDVYTHSEMLPAHYYPAFKKYPHFVGNYGNAWWRQNEEFESFNGVILFTTNCIVPPKPDASYANRVYTTGASGFEGFTHIADRKEGQAKDFSMLIQHAKQCMPPQAIEEGSIVGGFAHQQVFALADKVVEAVKSGAIRKFVVMAGCDGRMKSRDYYTQFAQALPKDTVILTAGCAKYRYIKLPLGDINGIPRVLDAGQCNDSYSLALIALKLKEVFKLEDVNQLPIVYNIAWYEQKAVIVLLALLSLGVKNIHLGPSLPAFLSPNTAKVLVEMFGIAPIGSVDEDIKLFFA